MANGDWNPDFRTLRSFAYVAEEKNMTRAAARLRVAQPALSRQISRLEEDLDQQVFIRTPRGVELTESGEILLRRVYAIFAQIEQAHHDVTALEDSPRGVVVVGMPPTPGEFIAPPLLARVRASYPEIELRFVEGFSGTLEGRLTRGEIGLAVMHDPPVRDDIVVRKLLVEPLCVVGPPGSFARDVFPFDEALQLPLVMPSRPNFLRVLVDQHADRIRRAPNVVQRCDGVWLLKALVRNGQGYTILTYGGVASEVRQGTLQAVPVTDPVIDWTLCTALRADQRRKRATQVVEQVIATIVESLVTQGHWQ